VNTHRNEGVEDMEFPKPNRVFLRTLLTLLVPMLTVAARAEQRTVAAGTVEERVILQDGDTLTVSGEVVDEREDESAYAVKGVGENEPDGNLITDPESPDYNADWYINNAEITVQPDGRIGAFAEGTEGFEPDIAATGIALNDGNTVTNRGLIEAAAAHGGEFGEAESFAVKIARGENEIVNYADIVAFAEAFDDAMASAVHAGWGSDVLLTNSGLILAEAMSVDDDATAFAVKAGDAGDEQLGRLVVTNNADGEIVAESVSEYDDADAHAIHAGEGRDTTVVNDGLIGAFAETEFGDVTVHGIKLGEAATSVVDNRGTIVVEAYAVEDSVRAFGIKAPEGWDEESIATIDNSGEILVEAEAGWYLEIAGIQTGGDVASTIRNTGEIDVWGASEGDATAFGIKIGHSNVGSIENTGDIFAEAFAEMGYAQAEGIKIGGDCDMPVTNSGMIVAAAASEWDEAHAVGIKGGYGDDVIHNTADGEIGAFIDCVTEGWSKGVAFGINAADGAALITNDGWIGAAAEVVNYDGAALAVGIKTGDHSADEEVTVINNGEIDVEMWVLDGDGLALGSQTASRDDFDTGECTGVAGIKTGAGNAVVVNTGEIYTYMESDLPTAPDNFGIMAGGGGNVVHQSGTISSLGGNAASLVLGCDYDGGVGPNTLYVMRGAEMEGDMLNLALNSGPAQVFFGVRADRDGFAMAGTADPTFRFRFDDDMLGTNFGWDIHAMGGLTSLNGAVMANSVEIAPGAILRGVGNYMMSPGAFFRNFGTLAPGNSVGTLTIDGGTYVQGAGAVLEIEFDASGVDQINLINGSTATLADGAVIKPVALGSASVGISQPIFTGDGSQTITAGAITVEDTSIFNAFTLDDTNPLQLVLDVTRDASFAQFGGDQSSMGTALDTALAGAPAGMDDIFAWLDNSATAAEYQAKLAELSPQGVIGAAESVFESSSMHLGLMRNGPSRVQNVATAAGGWQWWGMGFSTSGDQDSDGQLYGNDWQTKGGAIGAENRVTEEFTLGLNVAYSETDFASSPRSVENEAETIHFGVHGQVDLDDGVFVDGAVTYGMSENDLERYVAGATATADPDSDAYALEIGVGQELQIGRGFVIPRLGLRYGSVSQDGYTEVGAGGANLIVDDYERDLLESVLSIDARLPFRDTASLWGGLSWAHDFGDNDEGIDAAFAAAPGAVFTAEGVDPDDDRFSLRAGADFMLTDSATVFAEYGYTLAGDYDEHAAFVGLLFSLGAQ
jgi:outer membrane autotransporter protein